VEPELELQRDAAPATTTPAPNLMFNIGGLSKKSQTRTVSHFSQSALYQIKSEEIRRKYSINPYINFCLS
jgi:hypothetical protein